MKSNVRLVFLSDDISEYLFFSEVIQELLEDAVVSWAKDDKHLMTILQDKETTPQMIFFDLRPPFEHGIALLREIRENELLKDIPVVITSTADHIELVDAAFHLGAKLYVRKPATFYKLKSILQEVFLQDWRGAAIDRELFLLTY